MPSEEDLAWAAGLWEGEGTAGLYESSEYERKDGTIKRYPKPQIRVSNSDISLLLRFKDIIGFGSIYMSRRRSKHPTYKDEFTFGVSGIKHCINLANLLIPHVVSKYKRGELLQIPNVSPTPIVFTTKEQKLAWVAALFEGEGCAGIYFSKIKSIKSNATSKLYKGQMTRGLWKEYLMISNTQKDMLDAVKNFIGFGVSGLQRDKVDNWEAAYRYCVSNRQSRIVAALLLPYTISPRRRFTLQMIINGTIKFLKSKYPKNFPLMVGHSKNLQLENKERDWNKLYNVDMKSTYQIAEQLGIHPSNVHHHLKIRNIKTRSVAEANGMRFAREAALPYDVKRPLRCSKLNMETLQLLYCQQHLSADTIAKKLRVGRNTVVRHLKRYGIGTFRIKGIVLDVTSNRNYIRHFFEFVDAFASLMNCV